MRLSLVSIITCLVGTAVNVSADPITIMPLGDSITVGVNSTDGSGYRDPLYTSLTNEGLSFKFIGSTTSGSDATLINTGDANHNGYGHYTIPNLDANLTGDVQPVSADSNEGGDWFSGANAKPNIILLMAGTNDFLDQSYANIDANLTLLVTDIHNLSPNTEILIGGAIPIKGTGTNPFGDAGETTGYYPLVLAYDSFIQNTLVNEIPNTMYVNQVGNFLNTDGTLKVNLYSADGIHPDDAGYAAIASSWNTAIEQYEGIQQAPKPGTMALFGAGGLGLLVFGALRKKANASR